MHPYLVYDAPVDKKTLEIRKMFDVDEKTGYPRHYSWRPMAQLGKEYTYDEPFAKLGKFNKEEQYSTQVTMAATGLACAGGIHWFWNYWNGRPAWVRLHNVGVITAAIWGFMFLSQDFTHRRQAVRNNIVVDYVRKHPERFGTIQRPKIREVLTRYDPVR